jgi:hypothetical protein
MPIARITVTAVSDEGDDVIVWGRPEDAPDDSEPVGFVFQAKGEHADDGLAERASRLAPGAEAVIDEDVLFLVELEWRPPVPSHSGIML